MAVGVLLLMIPESACIPIPSEVTLMAAGFGVHRGALSLPVAIVAGTAGNLIGSLIAYAAGRLGLLRRGVARRSEDLFDRFGSGAVFICRLLPLARSFVSLPAGHARVPLVRFVGLTAAGCAIWSAIFVLAGLWAGAAWAHVAGAVGHILLAAGLLSVVGWLVAGDSLRR